MWSPWLSWRRALVRIFPFQLGQTTQNIGHGRSEDKLKKKSRLFREIFRLVNSFLGEPFRHSPLRRFASRPAPRGRQSFGEEPRFRFERRHLDLKTNLILTFKILKISYSL